MSKLLGGGTQQSFIAFSTRMPPVNATQRSPNARAFEDAWAPRTPRRTGPLNQRLTVQQAVSQKMSSDRTHYNKYSELEKTAHEARLHEATEKDLLRRSVGHLRELTEEELGRTQTAIVAEHKRKVHLMSLRHDKEMEELTRALDAEMLRPMKFSKSLLDAVDVENKLASHDKLNEWKHQHRKVSEMMRAEEEAGHKHRVASYNEKILKSENRHAREMQSLKDAHANNMHLWRRRRDAALIQLRHRHRNSVHSMHSAVARATRSARIQRSTFSLRTELSPLKLSVQRLDNMPASPFQTSTASLSARLNTAASFTPRMGTTPPLTLRPSTASLKGTLMFRELQGVKLPSAPTYRTTSVLAAHEHEQSRSKFQREWLTSPRHQPMFNL